MLGVTLYWSVERLRFFEHTSQLNTIMPGLDAIASGFPYVIPALTRYLLNDKRLS